MGESCVESIDLTIMDKKVAKGFCLEVSYFLFGMSRHNNLCTRHLPSARGTTSIKIHDTGFLLNAIEG